jgi:hypothetical protein
MMIEGPYRNERRAAGDKDKGRYAPIIRKMSLHDNRGNGWNRMKSRNEKVGSRFLHLTVGKSMGENSPQSEGGHEKSSLEAMIVSRKTFRRPQ